MRRFSWASDVAKPVVVCLLTSGFLLFGLVGTSGSRAEAQTTTLTPPGTIVGVVPFRLADTRPGSSTGDGISAGAGPVAANATIEVVTGGRGGVPANAEGVVLNIAAVDPAGDGYLTVWPCGSSQPLASTLNFSRGQNVANAAVTIPGTALKTCIYSSAATNLLVDVTSYYLGAGFTGIRPFRVADTRTLASTGDGVNQGGGPIEPNVPYEVSVPGRGSVPNGAGSVVLNVTVASPQSAGFVTVWPCSGGSNTPPNASTLNFVSGQTIANSVITKPGRQGKTCVVSSVKTEIIVDVTGFFESSSFDGLVPFRLADTRTGSSADGQGPQAGTVAANTFVAVKTDRGGAPKDVNGVVLNVTIVNPLANGFATVWPCGAARPNASTLNFVSGQTIANMVVTVPGNIDQTNTSDRSICVYTSATTHVIVDVVGFQRARIVDVSAAGYSKVLKSNGRVYSFGYPSGFVAKDVGLDGVIAISDSGALKRDGTVWTWGLSTDRYELGRLGSPTIPAPIPNVTNAVAISGKLILKADGTVLGFGQNFHGETGRDPVYVQDSSGYSIPQGFPPTPIPGLNSIVGIAGGTSHSVAVKSDGTVYTFGSNDEGRLGRNATGQFNCGPTNLTCVSANPIPGLVTDLASVKGIAASEHTIVLKTDGTVSTFGSVANGALGRLVGAAPLDRANPVVGLSDVIAVAASSSNSVVLKRDGSVWTFGSNTYGQLGRATAAFPNINAEPTKVVGLGPVAKISAGFGYVLALLQDGSVYSFGLNNNGQLGRDTSRVVTPSGFPNEYNPVPAAVEGLS